MTNSELVEKVAPTARWLALVLDALVDDSSHTIIRPQADGPVVVFRVEVPRVELGRLIGRNGRTARSLRTLLSARGQRDRIAYALDLNALEETPA
jgi:hypothetical protein